MTKGEYRVGINFNPSGNDLVDKIKRQAADLIDLIESIPDHRYDTVDTDDATWRYHAEVRRLKSLAITATEEGAMWAVKAATKQPMEVK